MNKLNAFKFVTRLIVGAGTTTISKTIISNNVTPSNKIEAISVGVASFVIGSMASEATKSHTDRQIDQIVDAWNRTRTTTEDPIVP